MKFNPNIQFNIVEMNTNYGFRASTGMEIAKGAPPFIFEMRNTDSPVCQTAKSIFNNSTSDTFKNESKTLGEFLGNTVSNHINMKSSLNTIMKECDKNAYLLSTQYQNDVSRMQGLSGSNLNIIQSTIITPDMIRKV